MGLGLPLPGDASYLWQMAALGAVQGLTEFLPVSSSAHLVFTESLLGLPRPGLVLEAVLHLGTVGAVLALCGQDLVRILQAWRRSPLNLTPGQPGRVVWLLLCTTAITGLLGLAFTEPLAAMFASVRWTAVQLVLTGLLLWWAPHTGDRAMHHMTWADAGWVGLAQAVSIVPGISRSGITIVAALWRGIQREEAARYSLLSAIPAILAASGFSLVRDWQAVLSLGYSPVELLVGFTSALGFGMLAIRWLVRALQHGRLRAFSWYCWIVGLGVLAYAWRNGV
ncbi:MAG: undecaprenyl-diphosphate phosphatase [Armatimonadota bacterium]|nr:undecaprenyl-diphosphate phosphatase [Armatimonadota bacterium]MDR7438402.1 undecaprenyl-diphosphate phosphatase [Armatimonadota bacterium]MDR7567181.1 undecaprenyl-diphosphate phosphatase [Armatimonadota bacterium]MDR7601246.1 undecaprenyl-diphosphate phosphatase [Armatimonadota bacterium]